MDTQNNDSLLKKGNTAFRNKEYDKAIKLYEQIKNTNKRLNSICSFNLALAQKKLFLNDTKYPKIIVYTCNFGNYESVKEPLYIDPRVQYILFTDNKNIQTKNWKIVVLEEQLSDPRRTSRLPKILPHKYLPEHDISVYLDSSFTIKEPDILSMTDKCLSSSDIALFKHYARKCVYDEINFLYNSRKHFISENEYNKIVKKYQSLNYPQNNGLFENGFIIRKNNQNIKELDELWWKEYSDGISRDQFILMLALWVLKIKPNPISSGKQIRKNQYLDFLKHDNKSFDYNVTEKIFIDRFKEKCSINWVTGGEASKGWAYENNAKRFIKNIPCIEHFIDSNPEIADVNLYFDVLIHYNLGMKFIPGKKNILRVGGPKPLQALYQKDDDEKRKKKALQKYDAIIALNVALAKKVFKYNKNVYVIPNGIDIKKWEPNIKKNIAEKKFVAGFAASIENKEKRRLKGYDFAKDACDQLGIELLALDKENNKIVHEEMLEKFYYKIDCLLHPVDEGKEGCSNVIMEAISCGIPVITTKHCGYHAELMQDEKNIIFCERDVKSISEKMLRLLEDKKYYNAISRNARAFAEEYHNIIKVSENYLKVIFPEKFINNEEQHCSNSQIIPIIPFAPVSYNQNLGEIYNKYMELLDENDWALFLDHDAMFTNSEWFEQIKKIINENPEAGLLTCKTSRINNPFQKIETFEFSHNIRDHFHLSKELAKLGTELEDVTYGKSISGVVLLISKKSWKNAKFIDGFLGVDNTIHHAIRNSMKKVYIMKGVYTYHFYRGDNDKSHAVKIIQENNKNIKSFQLKSFIMPSKVNFHDYFIKILNMLQESDWVVLISDDTIPCNKYWYLHLEKIISNSDPNDFYVCKNNITENISGYDYLFHRQYANKITDEFSNKFSEIKIENLNSSYLKLICISKKLLEKVILSDSKIKIDNSIVNIIKRTSKYNSRVISVEDLYVYSHTDKAQKNINTLTTHNRKIRIAMITRSFWPKMAGMEMMIHNLATTLTKMGNDVVLFAPMIKKGVTEIEHIYTLERHTGEDGIKAFEKHYTKKKFDIIYVQSAYVAASFALELKQKFKIPVVLRTHGEDIQVDKEIGYGYLLDPDKSPIILNNLKGVDHNITIGPHIYTDLCNIVNKDNVSLVYNGVDTSFFIPKRSDYLRKQLKLNKDTKIILTVGRNVKKKTLNLALEVLAILKNNCCDCVLVHMGKDGDAEPLSQIAKQLNVEDLFFPIGSVNYFHAPEIYNSSDLFLFPSKRETFGNVTIEAMSCGLPCVEFDYIVNRHKIENGNNGYIIPHGDIREMAEKVELLFSDSYLYKKFSKKSREIAVKKFSWEIIADQYLQIFRRYINE